MGFSLLTTRRKSAASTASSRSSTAASSTASLEDTLNATMLPLAPREDDYRVSEDSRRRRLLAKCRLVERDSTRN